MKRAIPYLLLAAWAYREHKRRQAWEDEMVASHTDQWDALRDFTAKLADAWHTWGTGTNRALEKAMRDLRANGTTDTRIPEPEAHISSE